MATTRAVLQAQGWQRGRDWLELPTLWDLDRPADYERALAEGLIARLSPRRGA